MKKILSILLTLAIVMSFATVAMSVSAATNDVDEVGATEAIEEVAADAGVSVGADSGVEPSSDAGKIYFEKPSWAGTVYSMHMWETKSGTAFFGFGGKKENLTEEGGKLLFDLSRLNDAAANLEGGFKSDVDYSIMFYDNLGNETCGLMFNSHCVGDTVKVTSNEKTFENTEDSTKHSFPIAWTNNADKYGIPLQITSVGTLQGEFISLDKTPDKIIKDWDKGFGQYPNAKSYSTQSSARDHKTRLAELKTEIQKMIDDGKVKILGGGVYSGSATSSSGGSSNGNDSSSNGSDSSSNGGGSSNGSDSSSKTVLKTKDGKTVTKDADGNYVDENGNKVDAADVHEETVSTVSTGETSTYVYVTFAVMLAAAGVYFLTRKKKA